MLSSVKHTFKHSNYALSRAKRKSVWLYVPQEIAGEKQADRDVNVAAAAHVSHATTDLQKLMPASGNSEEIEL